MAEDQDLGERDNEGPDDYPPAERRIHTQGYDLSLNTLKEQWDEDTLYIPEFQREYVWNNAKASRLIESLLLNIPIPVLHFAETEDARYEIVDGHQRVFSIVRYLDNQYALSGLRISQEFKGRRFHQLPAREQRFLKTRSLRAVIISHESSPTMKFEVFERLNTGGVALNAQEVRNAIYRGSLNDLLRELEQDPRFRQCLGTKKPRKRMVDRELVLRFLALHDSISRYRTPLLRFLNDYMRDNRLADDDWIEERRTLFSETVAKSHAILDDSAFRVTDRNGKPTERNVNRALFDAQMLALSHADISGSASRRKAKAAMAGVFDTEGFDDSIRRATGDKARIRLRIRTMADALRDAGIAVSKDLDKDLKALGGKE